MTITDLDAAQAELFPEDDQANCEIVYMPDMFKSALLDELAAEYEQNDKPIEAEWYRLQARKIRGTKKDHVIRFGGRVFFCHVSDGGKV